MPQSDRQTVETVGPGETGMSPGIMLADAKDASQRGTCLPERFHTVLRTHQTSRQGETEVGTMMARDGWSRVWAGAAWMCIFWTSVPPQIPKDELVGFARSL